MHTSVVFFCVLQMAVILRNLSFESENCNIMASDPLVFR